MSVDGKRRLPKIDLHLRAYFALENIVVVRNIWFVIIKCLTWVVLRRQREFRVYQKPFSLNNEIF